ncbi:MAG: hypothetical protein ACREBG_14105 [Pyrinomonadaceae bacterium]
MGNLERSEKKSAQELANLFEAHIAEGKGGFKFEVQRLFLADTAPNRLLLSVLRVSVVTKTVIHHGGTECTENPVRTSPTVS